MSKKFIVTFELLESGISYCSRCNQYLPIEMFSKTKKNKKYGISWWCKKCHNEYSIEWQKTEKGRKSIEKTNSTNSAKERKRIYNTSEKGKDNQRKYKLRNMEKYNAHKAVQIAINHGELIRPEFCSLCGSKSDKIYGHHYLGYKEENWLTVQWICPKCHKNLDRIKE